MKPLLVPAVVVMLAVPAGDATAHKNAGKSAKASTGQTRADDKHLDKHGRQYTPRSDAY